jgi:hypothetical protein
MTIEHNAEVQESSFEWEIRNAGGLDYDVVFRTVEKRLRGFAGNSFWRPVDTDPDACLALFLHMADRRQDLGDHHRNLDRPCTFGESASTTTPLTRWNS